MTVGLWVRLEATPGREADLATFLEAAVPLVREEPGTLAWFAIRLAPGTFGIFDTFPDDACREAHLAGRVAAALGEHASTLLASPPLIERVDVLAERLP